ncbi:hypothetical protein P8452_36321 [Trifolium repens]|nr:hypothetical protein P8452_36321 [Trifolium repens]
MSGAALRTTVVLSGAGGQWVQIWVRSEWFFHAGFRSGSGRDGKHLIGSDGWKLVFDMAQGWVKGVGWVGDMVELCFCSGGGFCQGGDLMAEDVHTLELIKWIHMELKMEDARKEAAIVADHIEGGIVGEFDEANQGLFMPLWIALSMMIY